MLGINKNIAKFLNYYQSDSLFKEIVQNRMSGKIGCCKCWDLLKKDYPDIVVDCWEINHFIDGIKGIERYHCALQSKFNKAGFKARNLNHES
jgi:hypothetical protein